MKITNLFKIPNRPNFPKVFFRNPIISLITLTALIVVSLLLNSPTVRALIGQQRGGSPASGSQYSTRQPSAVNNGLVGYWPMDGDATDQSGVLKNNLTDNNTVTQADGKNGKAAHFTAANSEYLTVADNTSVSVGNIDFSWAGWVKFDSIGQEMIAGQWDGGGATSSWRVYMDAGSRIKANVGNGSSQSADLTATSVPISTGNWYFVAFWHDATADTINLQVNNNGTIHTTAWATGVKDATNSLSFGAITPVTPSQFLDGSVDSSGFWKRTLSADERAALYNSGNGRAYRDLSNPLKNKMVSYWDFEEPSGTRLDSHSHGNDGTVTGATLTDGKFNQAYSFNGSTDYISITPQPAITQAGTYSFSAWIKPADTACSSGCGVFQQTNASSDRNGLRIHGGAISYSTYNGVAYAGASGSIIANVWTHVVAVDSAGTLILYLNGTAVSGTNTGSMVNSPGLFIGTSNGLFNGTIDDVRIYDRALSTSEIQMLYQGSNPPAVDQTAVGYWNLDEASGNTVRDATLKNANNLADNGTVTQNTGVADVGKSAQFTASNSKYLSIADNPSLSTGDIDFTIAGWMYLDSVSANRILLSKGDGVGSSTDEYAIRYNFASNLFEFTIGGSSYKNVLASNLGIPVISTWYYIVAWHDSAANTLNIQVNDGAVNSSATAGVAPYDTSISFGIGKYAAQYMDGRIADVGFWRRTLTTGERTSLYNSGSGKSYGQLTSTEKSSLVSYWNLDEASGTRKDSHAGTGLITGATSGEGVYGGGYGFNGSSNYIKINNNSLYNLTSDFTIGLWFKPSTAGIIVAKRPNANDVNFSFLVQNISGSLKLQLQWTNPSGTGRTVTAGDTIVPGVWHYAVVTHNNAANQLRFYLDGKTDSSNPQATPAEFLLNTGNLLIGAQNEASLNSFFTGSIDDVRIYNRALADYEIYDQYLAGKSGR